MLRNETTVIDQLFLELAQFTNATTPREVTLRSVLNRIRKEFGTSPMPTYGTLGNYIGVMLGEGYDGTVPVAG
jgi:hypothetical protein